ncbi:lytic murein transglycosylase B [Edwardsiella piscicida]|uniref:lytic murein transglycosylase B n=1 Tax=Edwardsiella piscicida TaxID=1263550 RepID=UPI001CED910D|nr:lytic murein transglycosylase B [Edwardsiella piscicida]AOP43766.2 lytic murein transglycosylase B [Edwardsiella piscicida]
MRQLIVLLPLVAMLSACSSHKPKTAAPETAEQALSRSQSGGFTLAPEHAQYQPTGDFVYSPAAAQFIDTMVREHGFERRQLETVLSQTQRLDYVLRLMDRQAPTGRPAAGPNGAWLRYRDKFITPDNIQNGVQFYNQYYAELLRAQQIYGVPPEIIVGIIGVETRWGRVMGKTRIIDALATLAFAYPRRADYFRGELQTYLLMAREEGKDPLTLRGSFAGAMGYGQFMPSAFQAYAVDFNGDGHVNLWDPVDAIGSVASYFKGHGWTPGATVAVQANGQAPGLDNGFKTRYSVSELAQAGLSPQRALADERQVSLLRLDVGGGYQYWYGLSNFYTITRYNHSTHYAMAVWQLGESVVRSAGR